MSESAGQSAPKAAQAPVPVTIVGEPAGPATPAPVAENANLWRGIVSVAVMVAFAVVAVLTMTRTVSESNITTTVLGILGSLATTVVGYWLGSSAGSTAKDADRSAVMKVLGK